MDQVADEAGLTSGAVYSNFANKEELFLATYEDYAARRTEEVRQAFAQGRDLPSRTRAAADQWMARFDAALEVFLLQLEFAAHAARNPQLRARFANREAAVPEAIARLLDEQATADGVAFPFRPTEMAVILRALGNGLALERLNAPELATAELFGDFTAWLFDSIAAGTPRPRRRRRPTREARLG